MTLPPSADAGSDRETLSLDQICGTPMEVKRFLKLAIGASLALAELHSEGTIHKDIRPRNILLDPDTETISIALPPTASEAPRTLQGSTVEYPAYMSPEQTGRMNRSIDYRSDLYSLGITFYEMLTGAPPFEADDLLEWIHCHVARPPRPAIEVARTTPAPVSDIIQKLLAKVAEERYQSARSLHADLVRCLNELELTGRITLFSLGERDVASTFAIPQKLYGCEEESAALLAALNRVVKDGRPELALVAGLAGTGKSSLVQQLHRLVARDAGFFIGGKFDQHHHDVPYATIVQAFGDLVQQILTGSEEQLASWRQRLRDALGQSGQIIIDVIPHVELIVGKQPPAQPLSSSEAQNRFNLVFMQFIAVFAKKEHPLALFLDDLQWADPASLKLLQHILTHPNTEHLLVIGAYRDDEVGPAHPWTATLDDIRRGGVRVASISLRPFSLEHIVELSADVFHAEKARVEPLARLVAEKTGSNPLFVTQFLTTLYQEGLVRYDEPAASWQWSIEQIRQQDFTDNIVEYMLGKLRRFPADSQSALALAACIGNQFDLSTLALVCEKSTDEVQRSLAAPVREGLLRHATDGYKFLHDRVQQAAYSLIDDAELRAVRLRIGRLMRSRTAPAATDGRIFDVVNHLNYGADLVSDAAERLDLAELNLRAGRRAMESNAHASARAYFNAGMGLLPPESWRHHYSLALALVRGRSECEYLCGNHGTAEQLFREILTHSQSLLDQAAVYGTRVVLYTSFGHYAKAVEVGQEALHALGAQLPATPEGWREAAAAEMSQMRARLSGIAIAELIDAPLMTDPLQQAISHLLTHLSSSAFNVDHGLLTLINVRIVGLSLDYGFADTSACGYAWYGTLLAMQFGDYESAGQLGSLAIRLVEKTNSFEFKSKVYDLVGWFVDFWCNPIDASLSYCQAGYRAGLQCGDLLYAGFNLMGCDLWLTAKSPRLDDLERELRQHRRQHGQIQHQMAITSATVLLQSIQSLRGRTHGWGSLSDGSFNEEEFVEASIRGKIDYAASAYHVTKMQLYYMFGDYQSAAAAAITYDAVKDSSIGAFPGTEYSFFQGLTLAALHRSANDAQKAAHTQALETHQRKLERWAQSCPQNFLDRFLLVSAEAAAISGAAMETVTRLYDQAIRAAGDHGFIRNEALANELAAHFFIERGFYTIGGAYLREAHACYGRWGAEGKLRQIEERYPELSKRAPPVRSGSAYARMEHLDVMTVVKTSQLISGEIVLDKLLATLMRIVVEHAGAQRGALLLAQGDALSVAARARVESRGVDVQLAQSAPEALADSIVQYVKRTLEMLVLDHAVHHSLCASDPYVAREGLKSVVCLPIVRHGALIGLFYLENNLVAGAFTPERLALLEFLGAQAAISLENATLYANLEQENAERTRTEQTLREKLDIIGSQQEAIRALSTPIIEVGEGVLTMPLFGTLDSTRAMQMQEALLEAVVRTRSRHAIVDLTGVDVVDTTTAEHIIKLVKAVQLLGARGIVVGIRPEVAQTIVSLGVDLSQIITLSNLREALRWCMQRGDRRARLPHGG